MNYCTENQDGTFNARVSSQGNIEWDATHYCPASALTQEESAKFRVVEFKEVPQPAYDPITHSLQEANPLMTGDGWTQQWTLTALPPEQVAANKVAAIKAKREAMVCTPWQIRKAMTAKIVRADVESAVAAAGQEAQDAYAFAQEFKRLDPLGMMIQAVLGKSDEYMDALFELGMTL